MDFFSFGPLATTIYFIICWLELVIILWLLYLHNNNNKLDTTIQEFTKILKESFIINLKKKDVDELIKDFDASHNDNEQLILKKIDEMISKIVKHDKRFFMRTKEIKNIFSGLMLSSKAKNSLFTERKIDFYGNEELSEDMDTDDNGYKEL